MNKISRRQLLKRSISATTGAYLGLSFYGARARSANNEIRVAIAGIHGRGNGHIGVFHKLDGVSVVALCDPDKKVLNDRLEKFKREYEITDASAIQPYTDIREVLDRKDIDVLVIATPNHWHSLMTVWACQAGKHVYVEKPVSHSIWEGRKMVEAARKYDRIVQSGMQQRSCPAVQEAARDIQSGKYGKVLWVHCSKLGTDNRGPIGKVTEPQPVPSYIDYNLWAGPAPNSPLMRKQFHYDWHWQWNWGDGELANWGVHYIDDVYHLLGWKETPNKVISAGNRFAWDDNGETPNMHAALFDHNGLKVVVDIRNLPDPNRRGGKGGAVYLDRRDGNYVQCENGSVRISRGGGWAYDNDGKRIHQYKGDGGAGHAKNFIDALRSGRREDLNADVEQGHLSAAMAHMANIAFRIGAETPVDELRESFKAHEDAANTINDMLEQLDGNGIDLAKQPFILGPELTFSSDEKFTGPNAEKANKYLKCSYREPFVLPETV